jgi:hypothetical protein
MACMPETRGQSLEAIQEAFNRPAVQVPSWTSRLTRRAKPSESRELQLRERRERRGNGESEEALAMIDRSVHVAPGFVR